MDPRIKALKSTCFQGRRFARKTIAEIQETVKLFPNDSRNELAKTLCEHLNWRSAKGNYKVSSCLKMLEALEQASVVVLPQKREVMRLKNGKPTETWGPETDAGPAIETLLRPICPIRLMVVTEAADEHQWNGFVARHHYLGFKRPFGTHLRYFIVDAQDRKLGCLMFEDTTKVLPCRDKWIGWTDHQRQKARHLTLYNSRFLVFPWVKVKFLASMALGLAARQLGDDWEKWHGYRPVFAETFVDPERFTASCYRAAGWQVIGTTVRTSGKSQKQVLVRELIADSRAILCGKAPKKPATARERLHAGTAVDAGFTDMWGNILDAAQSVAGRYDCMWQKRPRILGTLLIILFVFRLVSGPKHQGYAITLCELWDQCRAQGIKLPKSTPVAASTMTYARMKVDEAAFKDLHSAILAQVNLSERLWKGHRVFAVDGTKINLPRPLKDRFRAPSETSHYPQGLVSALYQLNSRIPCDFELFLHENERRAALTHLDFVTPGDVIVYDRGYYSRDFIEEHVRRNVHVLFRIKRDANNQFEQFGNSNDEDRTVTLLATTKHAQLTVRLIKCGEWLLATTLLDRRLYRREALASLYHGRWSIEELYKVSKQIVEVSPFHGQTERAVRQELYASFTVVLIARILANKCDTLLSADQPDKDPIRVNFKNSLRVMTRALETMLLKQADIVKHGVKQMMASLVECRQRERPGRSYERVSHKPSAKWRPSKA